jgi:hypothetical protein
MAKQEVGPGEKFAEEILAVCCRWWEESDLDEEQMMSFGVAALEHFCDSEIVFDSEITFNEEEEE